MADWDTVDIIQPNGHVVQDRKSLEDITSPTGNHYYFDNPAYRDDSHLTPNFRKNRSYNSDEHSNHLIYDVSRNRAAAINKSKERSRNTSGTLIIKKNADEFGTNRYSEPLVLNARSLDKQGTVRKHYTMGRNAANVYYTKSRKSFQKLYPTGVNTFKRHGSSHKANCISFFDIETDKVASYQYRPGEEVTGALNIIVKANIEIRYVELQVIGEGLVTLRKTRNGSPRSVKEVYLKKSTCVIGSADSSWTSLLTPGHYTSKFRIKLPLDLPSSLFYEDVENGFTYEVHYTLKARVCDDVIPTTSHRGSFRQGFLKAIISKKLAFNVQRSFDLNTIPEAMGSLTKTEQIYLSCTHRKPAVVSVTLERAVFLAGDDIRVQLVASLPSSQKVKEIDCSLREHLTFGTKDERMTFNLFKVVQKDPPGGSGDLSDVFDITIPTQTTLVSSFGVTQGHMKMAYWLEVSLRFKPVGGKLFFKIPIGIGPCAEPIYGEKTSTKKIIPVFNRPTRFPIFSPTPRNNVPTSTTPGTPSTDTQSSSVPVTSKYSNSFLARCFLCCRGISASDEN